MSLLTRKRVLLAKVEGVYGTDSTPAGSTDAVLVRNLSITPIDSQLVSRDLIQPYLGNSDQLLTQVGAALDFEVELAGAGAAGVAAPWAALLKACAFSETINTASITITRSGAVATVTQTAHGRASNDIVKVSGCSQTEYNGNQTITVVDANTYTFAVSGTPASPATGTPVAGVSAVYTPISSSIPSLSMYFNVDGVRHILTGARGTVALDIAAKQIPVLKFKFMGIYNAPTATALPSADFSGFQIPKVANTANTSAFALFGYSGYLESLALDMNGDVQHRTLIGYEEITFVDRKPSGTMIIEAPALASKDYFALAKAGTTGALVLQHGTVGGNIVSLSAPRVSLGNIAYQDSQGVQMLSIPIVVSPSSGNDEITLTVK
jgi:hypothetical protein